MSRVLLINMPFAGIAAPSQALGLVKARFRRDGIACDVRDLNVVFARMVGLEAYNTVPQYSALLAGEQMFAQVLFAGGIPPDQEYQADVLALVSEDVQQSIRHMKSQVEPFLVHCLQSVPWASYDIIGFTTLFEQNLASLTLAYQVKRHFPNKTIVFGGANCEDVMGATLHRCFPFVDFVCTGEADDTFPELVERLSRGRSVEDLQGIVYRAADGTSVHTGSPSRITNLDELPFPDYDDYFRAVQAAPWPSGLEPSILFETSRGCWWGEKAKCTFCGLNGQTLAFRDKGADRALEEIQYLVARHRVRSLRSVDNIFSQSYFDDFLPRLEDLNLNVEIFYEVTPNLKREQVAALARAGVTNVQAGIENLSSHVLRLMRKGTTGLKNIEFLKACKELGVYVDWNFLFGFPGETAADYAKAYELAARITHLKSPSCVGRVRLDRFSENFDHAEKMGLSNVRPWSRYRYVYPFAPDVLEDLVYYFDHDHDNAIDDGGYLARLSELVSQWGARDDQLVAQKVNGHLVIRDTRPVANAGTVVLEGLASHVYEHCAGRSTPRSIQEWLKAAHAIEVGDDELGEILSRFIADGLMVEDRGQYLSLAVSETQADTQDAATAPMAAVHA